MNLSESVKDVDIKLQEIINIDEGQSDEHLEIVNSELVKNDI